MYDYIAVSGTLEDRYIEYVNHLHHHFVTPIVVENGKYWVPTAPGYSIDMKEEALNEYVYPEGKVWQELSAQKKN